MNKKSLSKKLLALVLALVLSMGLALPVFAYDNGNDEIVPIETPVTHTLTVEVDGVEVAFEGQQPINIRGTIMVPVRGVFTLMGFEPEWDGSTRTATLTNEDADVVVVITIGETTFTVNGETFETGPQPAQMMNGRVMLPLRAIAEALGATPGWVGETQTAIIVTQAAEAPPVDEPPVEPDPEPEPADDPVEVPEYVVGTWQWINSGAGVHYDLINPYLTFTFNEDGTGSAYVDGELTSEFTMSVSEHEHYAGVWAIDFGDGFVFEANPFFGSYSFEGIILFDFYLFEWDGEELLAFFNIDTLREFVLRQYAPSAQEPTEENGDDEEPADENGDDDADPLVGSWRWLSIVIVFDADGTGSWTMAGDTTTFEWHVDDDQVVLYGTWVAGGNAFDVPWYITLEDDTLVLTQTGLVDGDLEFTLTRE